MIRSDLELKVTQDRIAYFQSLLAQLRTTTTREEFPMVSGGYRAEVETMQKDVREYLSRHVSETTSPVETI